MTNDIDERLEKYIAGEMTPEERVAFEDSVLANTELADRLYADVSVGAALETAARARRERAVKADARQPWWRRGLGRWLVPAVAAAAVVVVVVVQQSTTPESPPVFRGGAGELAAVEPAGDVSTIPEQFVWRPGEASAYRFELFDASSTPVYSTVTSDTVATPSDVSIPSRGYWTVTPLNDLNVTAGDPILTHYSTGE